jgi:hypothetical protein
VSAMKARAVSPWSWQEYPVKEEMNRAYLYFHRDGDLPATLCILRQGPGDFVVVNIVPDAKEVFRLSIDQYVSILRDFDERIAEPAAEGVAGMTAVDTDKRTLEEVKQHLLDDLLQKEPSPVAPVALTAELREWALRQHSEAEIVAGLQEAREQNGPELKQAIRRLEKELQDLERANP